jgi:hypothetical protein
MFKILKINTCLLHTLDEFDHYLYLKEFFKLCPSVLFFRSNILQPHCTSFASRPELLEALASVYMLPTTFVWKIF